MAGGTEGFTSQLAGMSKGQLYDIMSQMKTLIDQNQQQAKKILVENPLLTKALFQAQIMLGMVQPPQVMPKIQQASPQNLQQPSQPGQRLNVQSRVQAQGSSSQAQDSVGQQHLNKPSLPIPSVTGPSVTPLYQTAPSHSLQTSQQAKGHLSLEETPLPLPQSQIHNATPRRLLPVSQPSTIQSQRPSVSSQAQYSVVSMQPIQPPLPPQPRPPSMQPFPHQIPSQMTPNLSFPPPQQLSSQSTFHPGPSKPQVSIGSSFPQGQPLLPNHPPPQPVYKVGSHVGTDFSNQAGSSMQVERGHTPIPVLPENPISVAQIPGRSPLGAGQIGSSIQPPRPPQLTPEMEKALLQQVMSLTPEQINLLPPEHRNQVLQLQQMLH